MSEELGMKLEDVKLAQLGRARRIVVDKDKTTLIGGAGDDSEDIEARVAALRKEIEDSHSDYDKEKLDERIARLAGGVAVIRVGAPSESEMKARKDALDDAIQFDAGRRAGRHRSGGRTGPSPVHERHLELERGLRW